MASGADGRVAIAKETVFGTRVAPTRFLPLTSHTRGFQPQRYFSQAISVGRNSRPSIVTTKAGTTTLTGEVPTTGFGFLLDGLNGNTNTSTQQAATAAYLQTFTLDTPVSKSYTIQDQMPPVNSSVLVPHDLLGVVFGGITITWDPQGAVTFEIPAVCADIDLTQSLASYVAPTAWTPFAGVAGEVTIGGVAESNVLGTGSFSANYSLRDDAFYLGGGGKMAKPVETDKPAYTVQFTADFNDNTNITRVLDNTMADVVIKFEGATIASTYKYTLEITIPDCVFESELPGLDGPGPVQQGVSITAASATNDPPVIKYTSTDVTI